MDEVAPRLGVSDLSGPLPFDSLQVGMSAEFAKTVTDADLVMFAGVSGDTNPVHFDAEFAKETMFQGRIAHGMLSASLISTVLGTKLPGPGAIYMSQTFKFLGPVYPGDTVRARVTIAEIDTKRRRLTLETGCTVGGKAVVSGEAKVFVPEPKAATGNT